MQRPLVSDHSLRVRADRIHDSTDGSSQAWGKFLGFIQKQINERCVDVECEININNVELLVELADFVRAAGFSPSEISYVRSLK
jgi:hypothetical protein